jgi:hypothetical protein
MLINANHRPWLAGTALATAALTGGYVAYVAHAPYGPSGGSWPGLAFGVLGTACMLVAGSLSARKAMRTRRLGSAQRWMRLHIWLGLLAVPCIWFHSGFALGGALTTALMVLFYVVIASGVVGLVLQQFVPAAMTRRVPLETVLGQTDHVLAGLAVDAYEIVASLGGAMPEAAAEQQQLDAEARALQAGSWKAVARQRPAEASPAQAAELRAAYLSSVRPYLARPAHLGQPDLRPLLLAAPPEWRPKLDRLQSICEEARQLAVQRRLHALLHNWLFVHAPLSLALFVLVVVHVIYALRY